MGPQNTKNAKTNHPKGGGGAKNENFDFFNNSAHHAGKIISSQRTELFLEIMK